MSRSVRRVLAAVPGCALVLALLTSCERQAPPPPAAAAASQEVLPAADATVLPAHYPTLAADPQGHAVLAAYLQAWNERQQAPDALPPERERFLKLYAEVYRAHPDVADPAALDGHLRLLWDLSSVAHTTGVSPAEIKRASAWVEPPAALSTATSAVVLADVSTTPILIGLERLPALTRQMLAETRLDAAEGQNAGELVAQAARAVYFTPHLAQWSPSCPLDVCGSSEPLTRTLILTPVGQVDLAAKPEWSLAAVAVHESAHIAWFHRPQVSSDPRLLLPVPNEREAWRQTAQFLRGLLRSVSPALRQYVQANGPAIREMLQRSRDQVARANRVLRRPAADESQLEALPEGLSEDDLRALRR